MYKVLQGDALQRLKELPGCSIDSCVTDPPYELGFMGKSWDSSGVAYNVKLWQEVLRVLKPGGHLLAFGGTRTYHRMTCAIEDAGFEIRDCIQWIYGSGFPKSMDISKAIDKAAGAEREVVGPSIHHSPGRKSDGTKNALNQLYRGEGDGKFISAPATPEAQQWDGWGTALKPANEPIVLARKPVEGTVVANVLTWGAGGLNIDGCRVETGEETGRPCGTNRVVYGVYDKQIRTEKNSQGRFPANVIHDGSEEVLREFAKAGESKSTGGTNSAGKFKNQYGEYSGENPGNSAGGLGDAGSVSRFFYCAKASKSERGEKNNHPTVKPVKLMEYLIKLITPKGGTVLDPFTGSGTTLIAAEQAGYNSIGIELSPEYVKLINKRMANMQTNIFNMEVSP